VQLEVWAAVALRKTRQVAVAIASADAVAGDELPQGNTTVLAAATSAETFLFFWFFSLFVMCLLWICSECWLV